MMFRVSKQFVVSGVVSVACLWAITASAITPAQKCESAKDKAAGKLAKCFTNAAAKTARGGNGSFGGCFLKLSQAFLKAETNAAGQCPTTADTDAVYYRISQTFGIVTPELSGGARFVDNGDGTVTDNATGLMWEQKNSSNGVMDLSNAHDADNVYTWVATGLHADGSAYTDFLAKLNNHGTGCFAGQCDWRVPTMVELQELVDLGAPGCNGGSPCIDQTIFGPTQPSDYWSNTSVLQTSGVLVVDFSDGKASQLFISGSNYVRAVRGDRL